MRQKGKYFNSQPHKEADHLHKQLPDIRTISIHSLTRRLTGQKIDWGDGDNYFNSQPHKEADPVSRFQSRLIKISIHSLTRRLTAPIPRPSTNFDISIHSLTRRLTGHTVDVIVIPENFNSQPHKEADKV